MTTSTLPTRTTPVAEQTRAGRGTGRVVGQHTLVSASAALIGAISYGATLLMAHVLPVDDYTDYATVVSLLGTVGVASTALVPLPLAAVVRAHPAGSLERRRAVSFALAVAVLAGVVAAVALASITATFADTPVVSAAAASGFALLLIGPAWGVLQGQGRFGAYIAASVGEVSVRVAVGIVAIGAGWGAGGAVTGFLAGTVVVLTVGLRGVGADLCWQPSVLAERTRWSETGGIAVVQLALSALAGLDVVLIAVLAPATSADPAAAIAAAGYQAFSALTKAPLYIAVGAVLVSYPLLRSTTAAAREAVLRSALGSFAALAVPAAAILATAPPAIIAIALPVTLTGSVRDLPWLAVAGAGYATLTVLHLVLLGVGATRRCLAGLAPTTLLLGGGLVVGWQFGGIHGIAIGAAAGSLAATLVVVVLAAPHLPRLRHVAAWRALCRIAVLVGLLTVTRTQPVVWAAVVVVIGLVMLRRATRRPAGRHTLHTRRSEQREPTTPVPHPRILHLGFEDPAMPGAGGGSVRTHEINRRLATTADITVLTTRFPGCQDRVQDGVRYIHIGVGTGRTRLTRVLGYMLILPFTTRHRSADLVVEDFFAPISTMAAPLWSGRPTIGVVQWLNARQKARQYHLPVHIVERAGVRRHDRLIAMSDDLADQLRAMNPHVSVTVIGNGVDQAAFREPARLGEDIVFLGRLETAQKGLDLLLQAWALAAPRLTGNLVIAGTGPDEDSLRAHARSLGIGDRTRFVGWRAGAAKFELLASARLVVVPSRFETFGIVAVEALAAATPVLAFDIPCLRAVVPSTCGHRVPTGDVAAFADAIAQLGNDPDWLRSAGQAGRTFAAGFDWDRLAAHQNSVYRSAIAARSASVSTSLTPARSTAC